MAEPLDRFLARRLRLAVRECRRRIQWGRIQVDGRRCQHYHLRLQPGMRVEHDGIAVADGPDDTVLICHKPRGLACSHDPDDAPLIYEAVPEALRHPDLHTCGRLDRDTSGLLILTSDGRITRQLAEPDRHVVKRYELGYTGGLCPDAAAQAASGAMRIDGDEVPLRPARLELDAAVSCALDAADRERLGRLEVRWAALEISEGRHHQVKRMIRQWGGRVVRLHRTRIGDLCLPADLPPGAMRVLPWTGPRG